MQGESDGATAARSHHDTALTGLAGMSGATLRRAVWAFFAVIVAVFAILIVAPLPDRFGYAVGQWVWAAVSVAACAGALAAASYTRGIERRFWSYLSIAGGFIVASQAYFAFHVAFVDRAGPDMPSISTLMDMAAIGSFTVLLTTLTRFRHASLAAQARYVLDSVAIAAIGTTALYAFVISPWFDALGTASEWAKAFNSLYPVLGVFLLVGAVRSLLGTRMERWESWERLVASGLTCFAAGLVLYPFSFASTEFGFLEPWPTVLVETSWLVGLYVVFAATVYRHTESSVQWRLRPLPILETARGWLPSVIMPAVEVLAIPAFGLAGLTAVHDDRRLLFLGAVMVLGCLLFARTVLTVADNGHLFSRSVTDPLTGLFNHRHFHDRLSTEVTASRRYGEEVSLVILDLDDFSRINSVGGHAAGDRALVEAARAVVHAVRERDAVCRIGGDEIAVILPETSLTAAVAIAERICEGVRAVSTVDGCRLTASVGVASHPAHGADDADLVRVADGAQYWAKYHGKDRVIAYDPDVVVTLDPDERIRSLQDRAHLGSVRALAAAVDARDSATEHHSRNVAALAVAVGRELGYDEPRLAYLEIAGLLHDVGKIALPDSILRKRGPLSADEWVAVREHPVLGQQIVSSTRLDVLLPWIRHHHERWDGLGYPDGLAGTEIPAEARILALCDAYDAMTSERPYRGPLSHSAALQEIDLNLGAQFDPKLGELFISVAGRRRAS